VRRTGSSSGAAGYYVNVIRSIRGLIYVRGMHVRRLANQAQCLKLNANIDVRDYSDSGCPFLTIRYKLYSNLFCVPPTLQIDQSFVIYFESIIIKGLIEDL